MMNEVAHAIKDGDLFRYRVDDVKELFTGIIVKVHNQNITGPMGHIIIADVYVIKSKYDDDSGKVFRETRMLVSKVKLIRA